MSQATAAIETWELGKTFGETRALAGIELEVPRGCVYGVLGPNGAGKTTLIRVLATLLRPDAGGARVFGHDVVAEAPTVRRHISLTGQYASVDDELTGLDNLTLAGRLMGYRHAAAMARAAELLDAFDLAEAGSRRLSTYSGGERRRIDIAASLVILPELLFLDEPTTGLDPRSRHRVWEIIRGVVDQGTTVLLTTQYLDEADQLAGRIALIDRGKVVAEGTPAELKRRVGAGVLHVGLNDAGQLDQAGQLATAALGHPVQVMVEQVRLSAQAADPKRALRALSELAASGISVSDFALAQPSLDEVFFALTGSAAAKDSSHDGVNT